MILVMGAGGNVGRALVKELLEKEARFRASYRSAEEADDARRQGIDAVIVDYARPKTLRAELKGMEKLFFVTTPRPNLAELEGNIVEVARVSGVRHLVKLSVWGAEGEDFIFSRLHRPVEKMIEASGLGYTFLRPNGFMQNILAYAPMIKAQGAFFLPAGEARVSEIDVRDIARVAATVLSEKGHKGKAYELSGPQALSHAERADILSDVLGRPVAYVSPPEAEWKQTALGLGLSEWLVDGIIDLLHYYQSGQAERVTPAVKELTEREPISFRQFAQDHAEAFS